MVLKVPERLQRELGGHGRPGCPMGAADPPFPSPSPSDVAHWVSGAGSGHLEEVGACPSCRTGGC